MSMVSLEVFFSAVDSLYFRGSRPHSAAGASRLPSDFPPPVTTLVGSIRTRLGDALGVNWSHLNEKEELATNIDLAAVELNLGQLIGGSKDTGLLEFSEPRLYKAGQRLFPVPAVLLQTAEGKLVRLELGNVVNCDLGRVRLPSLPAGVVNAKPLEDAWLTEEGIQLFLQGKLPEPEHVLLQSDLLNRENRLGIGRDVALATVKSGLLYQTEHLRLASDVEFSIVVSLPKDVVEPLLENIKTNPLQRFGGEGRMAYLRVGESVNTNVLKQVKQPTLLMLLTDMLPYEDFSQYPIKGLEAVNHEGIDCWEGQLNGMDIRLQAVVSAKARRYGGWDIRYNRPREVQSYIPAGSCFFIEPLEGSALEQLNGCQIGRRTDFGFGTLLCAQ